MTQPLIDLQGVTKRFGGLVALDGVDLTVAPGEFVSVIGPNGAGKSTLFNVISGVTEPSAGTVTVDGRRIRQFRPDRLHALGLGRTFQVARPVGSLSVRQNVLLGAGGQRLRGVRSAFRSRARDDELQHRVDELLEFADLKHVRDAPANEVTPGDLRRMEIARALADDPRVVLMDEPAAGIGAGGLQPLRDLIKGVSDRGIAVLLVEHYVGLALSLCDRAMVLDRGKVLAVGTPEEVRQDQRVIAAYLGTRSQPTTSGTRGPTKEGS
jgi:ABC-type branched-subunit amino acid transport system ATPase component